MGDVRCTFSSQEDVKGDTYMGIDQSLTGFALCVLDDSGNYYGEVISPRSDGVARLSRIHQYVREQVALWKPTKVAMEGTVYGSASASVLGELSGVVKLALHDEGVSPLIVPPMSLKKFVIGSGSKLAKSHMLLSVYKRYSVELQDDNAADAYGLARIARGRWVSAEERTVLSKLGGAGR